jgi:hypothetical protein
MGHRFQARVHTRGQISNLFPGEMRPRLVIRQFQGHA